jgi:hypothetical protein
MFDNWIPGIGTNGMDGIAPHQGAAPRSNKLFPCTAVGLERVEQQVDALLGLLRLGPSRRHLVLDDPSSNDTCGR